MGITIPRQLVLNYIIKLPKLHPKLLFVRVFYHSNRIKQNHNMSDLQKTTNGGLQHDPYFTNETEIKISIQI